MKMMTKNNLRTMHGNMGRQKALRRREGATMLVTMLVLISVTGLAVFSIHSTSRELRAAGHLRQAMQAKYLATAGIDATFAMVDNPTFGPDGMERAIRRTSSDVALGVPSLQPYEPDLEATKQGCRLFSRQFGDFGGFDPAAQASLGPVAGTRQPYTPGFEVDVNDWRECGREIPGFDGTMRFRCATFTSRSRLSLTAGDFAGTAATDTGRAYHDVSSASRAEASYGPI